RRVGRMLSPAGSPKARRALPGSRTSPVTDSPRASTPRTISLPTRPVAPITAVVIVPLVGLGDVAGDAAPRPRPPQRRRGRLAFADRQRAARPEAAALAGIDDSRGLADVARVGEAELGTRIGDGREEKLRVRVLRPLDDVFRRPLLDEMTGVQHEHAVGDVAGARDVMRDVEERDAFALTQLAHQVENPDPDRDVEHRHGLVRDDQLRLDGERLCEPDPLALSAAQLIGKLAHDVAGRDEADGRQNAVDFVRAAAPAEVTPVELDPATDAVRDAIGRV